MNSRLAHDGIRTDSERTEDRLRCSILWSLSSLQACVDGAKHNPSNTPDGLSADETGKQLVTSVGGSFKELQLVDALVMHEASGGAQQSVSSADGC